jgi:hypothetical protein
MDPGRKAGVLLRLAAIGGILLGVLSAADAAIRLIKDRYLLSEDLPRILEAAARHWDYRTGER